MRTRSSSARVRGTHQQHANAAGPSSRKRRSRHAAARASSSQGAQAAREEDKILHLVRHGTTEMNVYLSFNAYGSPGFQDPLLYDTRLTPGGEAGAKRAAAQASRLSPAPELLVVSPLSRALHTAQLVFGARPACPVLVEALWRERIYLSSDVGRHPSLLAQDFPHLEFDHLDDVWWRDDGGSDPLHVAEESDEAFGARVDQLREWIRCRPERCLAVVSHWACLYELTGHQFDNCEVRTLRMSQLRL